MSSGQQLDEIYRYRLAKAVDAVASDHIVNQVSLAAGHLGGRP